MKTKKQRLVKISIIALVLSLIILCTAMAVFATDTASAVLAGVATAEPTVSADGKIIILPEVPDGYAISINGSSNESVIDINGNVYTPLVDTTVKLNYKVTKIEDGTVATDHYKEASVLIKGKYQAEAGDNAEPAVLPKLQEWKGGNGTVKITASSRIVVTHSAFMPKAEIISEYIADMLGAPIEIVTGESCEGDIVIGYTNAKELGKEGYTVELSDRVTILAYNDIGALYGGTTVSQMLSLYDNFELPKGYIRDYSAYEVRSSMLDVSGQWLPMKDLLDLSKYFAYFKVNQIHIHVNENAGQQNYAFRIESKKYPAINSTLGDRIYTQEEYRTYQTEMLKYGVKIITEIDSPAHCGFVGLYDSSLVLSSSKGKMDLTNDYDGCVEFMKGLLDEFVNGYDGNPPVIIDEIDAIHLGMDEYTNDRAKYKEYMKEICDYAKSLDKHVLLWSALQTEDFAEELPISSDNITINYWGDADLEGYINNEFQMISNRSGKLYVVPGGTTTFGDWRDVASIYDSYEATQLSSSVTLAESSPLVIGVEGAIWHHANVGASKEGIFARVRDQMLLVSEKAWHGNAEGVTGEEFEARLRAIQNLVPVVNPQSYVPSNEDGVIADYDFDNVENGIVKDTANGYDGTLEGVTFENSAVALNGSGYLALPIKQVGFPYTATFGITYSSTTTGVLFAGGDTTFWLNANGDGKITFTRELHSYGFDFVFAKDVRYEITLLCDKETLSLYVDGVFIEDAHVIAMETQKQKFTDVKFSESVLSCARIGEGIVGTLDTLKITASADRDAFLGLTNIGYHNVALGKETSASGTEVSDKWFPENAVDGITVNDDLRVSLNRIDNSWLTIDLGKVYSIDKIKIYFRKAPEAYKFLVSEDGVNYTEIYDEPSAAAGTRTTDVIELAEAVGARYVKYQQVKMFSTTLSNGQTARYSGSIFEIEVMGAQTDIEALNLIDSYLETLSGDAKTHLYNRVYLVKKILSYGNTDVSALAVKLIYEEYERMRSSSYTIDTEKDEIYDALLDMKLRKHAISDARYSEYETAYKLTLGAYINSGSTEAVKENRLSLLTKATNLLTPKIETTPYGDIDMSVHPLNDENAVAVFENNGDGSYTLLKTGAWAVLKDYYYTTVKKEVKLVAYLRCDHTIPVSGKIDPSKISGTVTFDLNGKTLTRTSNDAGHMFDVVANNACAAYTTNIVMKNGTLNSVSGTMIGINNSGLKDGTDVTYTKNLNIDFENVTFKYGSDSATKSGAFFNCWKNSSSTADNSQIKINLNFDDKCVYDFAVMPADAVMFAVTGNDSTKEADVVANFYGGTVKLANSVFGNLFTVDTAQDTVNMYPGSNGKLMKIETNVVTAMDTLSSTATLTASNGTFYYVIDANASTSTSFNYYLGTEEDFPFEVFDPSGASVGKYLAWSDAFAKADDKSGSTIKLLKDVYQITAGSASGNFGTITLDLNGHTLTKASSAYLINTYFANTKAQSTKIIIKNGTMVKASTANKYGFICINYTTAANKNTAIATIDFDFSNVTFENEKTDNFIFSLFENGKDKDWTKGTSTTAVFTDCTFKYRGTVFMLENAYADATKSVINLQINGGQFIAATDSAVKNLYNKDTLDTVTFGKGSDGKYPVFTVPNGISVPAAEDGWNTTDGVECVMVKTSETDSKDSYTLYPAVMVGYKIKTSVTLYSNFVYNVYIPKANVNSFKVNGITVPYEEVEIGGVMYYHVAVNLAVAESLNDIKLAVTLNSGETTVTANWTLNVLNYTKSVINGNYDSVTKTLMKDMLVYASAAHTYFDNALDTTKANEVTAILSGYNAALPTGDAKAPASNKYFTSATVYLGEVPSFRFYLAEGYSADDFTFKIGGRNANVTVGDGYVEIQMYAYMMLDDVTFTVKETNVTESYNLYFYYAYAKTLNNANLTLIVEELMKYSVSANNYRRAILASGCNHEYISRVEEKATATKEGIMKYHCSKCGYYYTERIPTTLKVLAIGNSFSIDAMEHLYIICKDAGIENVVLGNLWKSSCDLETHLSCMQGNTESYTFAVSSDEAQGMITNKSKSTAQYGIEYTDWDFITLQQRSAVSGISDSYSYLDDVISYVNAHKNADAKLLWHMTWGYQDDYTSDTYASYDNDQMTMYNAIVSCVQNNILTNSNIVGVIPGGTAIQNLRTSHLGDTLNRDGVHLSYDMGRYAAALTYFAFITGGDISSIDAIPSAYPQVAEHLDCIKDAVKNAIVKPYEVTDSAFPPTEEFLGTTLSSLTEADKQFLIENGYDPDLYMLLNLSIYENTYYDSTLSPNPYVRPSTHNLYFKYLATQIFTKDQLINGTLIRINEGYKYRAMGWENYPEKSALSKPANVEGDNLTVVDDAWWGDYTHRVFNIQDVKATSSASNKETIYLAEGENFRIYVPVAKKTALTAEDVEYLTNLGLNADEYMVLDYTYTLGKCYDSRSSANQASNSKFLCTNEKFTRYDITLGSVIRITSGYQYRPDGWTSLDVKTAKDARPAVVTDETVIVDMAWWGDWNYRAFNVQKTDGTAITNDGAVALRIYVKVA